MRGPATLLYGANAIGGLVNVVSEIIPTTPSTGTAGAVQFELGSAAGGSRRRRPTMRSATAAGRFNAGGSGRRSGDVSTPLGDVENTQSRSAVGHVGAAWTADKGFLGASYQYDDTQVRRPGRRRRRRSA